MTPKACMFTQSFIVAMRRSIPSEVLGGETIFMDSCSFGPVHWWAFSKNASTAIIETGQIPSTGKKSNITQIGWRDGGDGGRRVGYFTHTRVDRAEVTFFPIHVS